jgi:acyl dehydratase
MEINSSFTGTRLREFRKEIGWRGTMNYAAAIDDMNEMYFNDERPGGVMAPPMYSVAVTWPVSERVHEYLEVKDFPREVLNTQVHYTEHLEFHRPVVPGDVLSVRGKVAAILPHRAGTLVVVRYDALDAQGKPVFTEHMGGMMRGVTCVGEGRGGEEIPAVPEFKIEASPVWTSEIGIDPMRPFIYDGCTDIYFPIHTSVGFAHMVGLPGIILQGTATLAYAAREITDREAGRDPRKLKCLACRFTGMVMPGSSIRVQVLGKDIDGHGTNVFFNVLNAEGGKALNNGYARIEG